MAHTDLSVIVAGSEELFNDYIISRIMEKSAFIRSGVVSPASALVPVKGKVMHFPYFNEIDGDNEVLSDSSALTVNALTTGDQVAVINFRGKAWGVNDLVEMVAGTSDPLKSMAGYLGDYWARQYDLALVKSVDGAALGLDAAYGAGSIVNDISALTGGAELISAEGAYDTMQLMGEYADGIDTIVMHSATHTYLSKLDLIDFLPDSTGRPVQSYIGRKVVVDDRCTVDSGDYHTYFCKSGAVGLADGTPSNLAAEFDRNILSGNNEMTTRRRFVLHPAGASFAGSPAGVSPTNVELGTAGSWTNAFDDANKFGIRVLKHKIA